MMSAQANDDKVSRIVQWHYMSHVMRKPDFCICENKGAYQLCGNSDFVFATEIEQSLNFLNPKFQDSSYLLWLYSPVYVEPFRKLWGQVFW